MRNLILYPSVPVVPLSFKGCKRVTKPNDSMSLKEIIQRFIKKEALPALKQGIYEDRYGDLEKIAKADLTEQHEYLETVKARVAEFRKADREKKEAEAKAAKDKERQAWIDDYLKSQNPTPGKGETPVKTPPL